MPGVAPFPVIGQNNPVVTVADPPVPAPTGGVLSAINQASAGQSYFAAAGSGGGGASTIGPNPSVSTLSVNDTGNVFMEWSNGGATLNFGFEATNTSSFILQQGIGVVGTKVAGPEGCLQVLEKDGGANQVFAPLQASGFEVCATAYPGGAFAGLYFSSIGSVLYSAVGQPLTIDAPAGASVSSLNVSSINGSVYPPTVTIPSALTCSTLTAATSVTTGAVTTSSLTVSTINGNPLPTTAVYTFNGYNQGGNAVTLDPKTNWFSVVNGYGTLNLLFPEGGTGGWVGNTKFWDLSQLGVASGPGGQPFAGGCVIGSSAIAAVNNNIGTLTPVAWSQPAGSQLNWYIALSGGPSSFSVSANITF